MSGNRSSRLLRISDSRLTNRHGVCGDGAGVASPTRTHCGSTSGILMRAKRFSSRSGW
jgi:hypothetical protein